MAAGQSVESAIIVINLRVNAPVVSVKQFDLEAYTLTPPYLPMRKVRVWPIVPNTVRAESDEPERNTHQQQGRELVIAKVCWPAAEKRRRESSFPFLAGSRILSSRIERQE